MVTKPTAAQRRMEIQDLLASNTVSVVEMSRHFGVSAVTIRKDLRLLEKDGLVVRGHGVADTAAADSRYSLQRELAVNKVAKQRIASEAANLVGDREMVLLGPGSICCILGQLLCKRKDLILVTNAVSFEPYLAGGNARVLYLGGEFSPDNGATFGSFAVDALHSLSIDRLFIGATGISAQGGITSYNFSDTLMVRTMIQRSKQVVLLSDHTKFGVVSAIKIADTSQIHRIITDDGLLPQYQQEFEPLGIPLTLV